MSHSKRFNINGQPISVHFNSDYSGPATIFFHGKGSITKELEVPAQLLLQIGKEMYRDVFKSAVEDAISDVKG